MPNRRLIDDDSQAAPHKASGKTSTQELRPQPRRTALHAATLRRFLWGERNLGKTGPDKVTRRKRKGAPQGLPGILEGRRKGAVRCNARPSENIEEVASGLDGVVSSGPRPLLSRAKAS